MTIAFVLCCHHLELCFDSGWTCTVQSFTLQPVSAAVKLLALTDCMLPMRRTVRCIWLDGKAAKHMHPTSSWIQCNSAE